MRPDTAPSPKMAVKAECKCRAIEQTEKRRMLDKESKKKRWREYNREKQQLYVHQKKSEIEQLRQLAESLERDLAARHGTVAALSWKDVSLGLQEECQLALSSNRLLRQQKAAYTEFVKLLARSMDAPPGLPQSVRSELPIFALRKLALLATPECRQIGFDWLTHLVFQNTDWILERYPFTDAPDEFVVDHSNPDCLQYVWRNQRLVADTPFEVVVDAVQQHVVAKISMTGLTDEQQAVSHMRTRALDPEMLRGTTITYACATFHDDPPANGSKLLFRRYFGRDRFVAVGQTIPEDEALPSTRALHRKSIYWCVAYRAGSAARVRTVLLSSHSCTLDGRCVSLRDEARAWGCDADGPDGDAVLATFLRQVHTKAAAVGATCVQLLDNTVAALAVPGPAVVDSLYGFSKLTIR
ncbi:hypothetical protein ACHHYP_09582 [Achlya hypogyna]|uniref:Uncharacterized protein n=1 Tax=Achlya hypogyna TaxID=1202772 RepID=A0A1V9YMU9_ACHHY|nr:hypothetical protein ACHHYP_09582 [Achlya hypogyna]